MRVVRERGGPCLGYQSEVEHGKKIEVHSDVLLAWVDILEITPDFARGHLVPYAEDKTACKGKAGDIAALIYGRRPDLPDWKSLDALPRLRAVLRLIVNESKHLPRVVLAYVLSMGLDNLDGLLVGTVPPTKEVKEAVEALTTLPSTFFKYGEIEDAVLLEEYLPAILLAQRAGMTCEALQRLIERASGSEPMS
jgi:hypothetical protein